MTVPESILIRDCAQCGAPFAQPRRRGRPWLTCSPACRAARGSHGDLRLTRGASTATGVVRVSSGERHSNVDRRSALLADLFGDSEGLAYQTEEYVRRQTQRAHTRERAEAGEELCVTDRYGLDPARDEGSTCYPPHRVIGQKALPHDWQETYIASAGKRVE